MLIRIGFDITYASPQATPMVLMLSVHPSRRNDLVTPDALLTAPFVKCSTYTDMFGNLCTRLVAPPGEIHLSADALVRDSGLPDPTTLDAPEIPVANLPSDVLAYLLGSRYCETDQLVQTAWNLFGHTQPGWSRVQAIVDFVHQHIEFGYQHARPTKTAFDAFREQRGVCRDFAHLAITLCRCMNIPARYATGYLGDIGVPIDPAPMDFSAWFEVYLGGAWHTFDARHNHPRIGRVLMAHGRDAADVALTTSFGQTFLTKFVVCTQEIPEMETCQLMAAE